MKTPLTKFEHGTCTCDHSSGKHEVGGGRCTVYGCKCKKYEKEGK